MRTDRATWRRDGEFQGWMRRVREGDSIAREQMYRDYGEYFRRVVANRLHAQQLAWATTPHDIFNTVVVRIWEGKALATLRDEVEFLKYVARAIDREILDLHRELTAPCRDFRRQESLSEDDLDLIVSLIDPVRQASAREELNRVRAHFPVHEQPVLELWLAGDDWKAIGHKLGVSIVAIRRQFHRSLTRVRKMMTDPLYDTPD